MKESLLSPTNIILFGRVFPLSVDKASLPPALGGNCFLREQLNCDGAKFARIYAFSYEGTFYNLPKPAIFLVHGDGEEIKGAGLAARGRNAGGITTESGLVAKDFDFERSAGLGVGEAVSFWEYDKGDFSLRCDIVSGTFDEILLEAALSITARDALTSRSDLTARSDLTSRSDITSRSDLTARHRLKG